MPTCAPTRWLLLAAFAAWANPARSDQLEQIGTFTWPTEAIVGLSGLEVSDDGMAFSAVADRGWYISGRFERENQQITDVTVETYLPIRGGDGLPVSARRVGDLSDAEGLAIAPDGTHWISFERWARVARFPSPEDPAVWIRDHPNFADHSDNRQLEALAIDSQGILFSFPERPTRDGFPVYRLESDIWSIDGHIPEERGFSIVGADFATDDQLYLLERKLVLGLWWQNQIRRLDINDPTSTEVLWTGGYGEFFNLEGIAFWQDEIGPRLTLVSDNNGDRTEPTQFVEFRIVPAP